MTKAGFGEHLKREREMRGVSLDEICAATRIGNRFLEALENEDWDRLPGGIFNRGFVRAVARFLGLDEEAFVAEYVLATSEQNHHDGALETGAAAAASSANHTVALGWPAPGTRPDCGWRLGLAVVRNAPGGTRAPAANTAAPDDPADAGSADSASAAFGLG